MEKVKENKKEEAFYKLECFVCEINEIQQLLDLMNENFLVQTVETLDEYDLIHNYKSCKTMTFSILNLLQYKVSEIDKYIKDVHEETKNNKTNENEK